MKPLELLPLEALFQLTLVACGIGWVITGSKIGKIPRVLWHLATGWIPRRPLASLAFCPPCCTWWCGFALAALCSVGIAAILQTAFTAAFIMAIANNQWALAADDEEQIASALRHGGSGADSATERDGENG